MPAILGVVGAVVVVVAVADTLTTVFRVDRRGGQITRIASGLLWRTFGGGPGGRRSTPPAAAGLLMTIGLVGVWVLLALLGWYLVFLSDPDAVVSAMTGQSADAWSRLYFVAYTLSTVGHGDYVPSGAPWQVVTGIASGFGFALATLVITYMAGVTSAVIAKRRLARSIWGLGRTPQAIVRRAWDGGQFSVLQQHLLAVLPQLHTVAEQHQAYPLMSYFRSADRRAADVPALGMLQDVLLVIASSDRPHRLPDLVTAPLDDAMETYVRALPGADVDPRGLETPPWPDLSPLRDDGIPVGPVSELDIAEEVLHRRRRLAALMRHQGWRWEDVEEPPAAA